MMKTVVDDTTSSSWFYWAVAYLTFQLAGWGATVSRFFHSCPLTSHSHSQKPCKNCQFKGRMASKLAEGTWLDSLCQQLLNLPLGRAAHFLNKLDGVDREFLMEQFNSAKLAMGQRFVQVYSYWRELPWRICAVATCLFYDLEDQELYQQFVESSKAFARDVVDQWGTARNTPDRVWSGNGHRLFHMARRFLDNSYPGNLSAYLVYWANSPAADLVMPEPLAKELLKYTTALTVMQPLEAQHHYLAQKISFGRASLPASTCAFLRRRMNQDIHTPYFRSNLNRLIGDFSKLVAIKWEKRSDACFSSYQRFSFVK